MIPQQLTLKNFLSYQDTTLDFRGLHTACICGANGAGKSSLLEAITWVLWGKSRADSEDDVLHNGSDYVRVDFLFENNQETYKIIRSRHRGKSSALDFLIKYEVGFRSLSGKGLRATQEQIIAVLKLDYDTFINSAYLRQGRADEFMLKGPSDRKQILANLLKLDQYEVLAIKAKDISKQKQGQIELLEATLQAVEQDLAQREVVEQHRKRLEQEIETIQKVQEQEQWQLQQLQTSQNQRRTWQKQLDWQQSQAQNLILEIQRLDQADQELKQQLQKLQAILDQSAEIQQNYQEFLQYRQQESELAAKFQLFQEAQQQQQQLEQEILQTDHAIQLELKQFQMRLDTLNQQEKELQPILTKILDIENGLSQLRQARQKLAHFDSLQHRVSPLQQRRYELQSEIERAAAQLQAKREQRQILRQELQANITEIPRKRQALQTTDAQIKELDKKKVYQKRVHEKGQERRHFQERLQEHQRLCEEQIQELIQKQQLLDTPGATCPLCEQSLDGHYHQQVIHKTQEQQQQLQEQIWVLKEQMSVCERELQILRGEYTQIKEELGVYDTLQQQYGQLEADLERSGEIYNQITNLDTEIEQLDLILAQKTYAQDLQQELLNLNQELEQLQYDEQSHALVRGEVEKYRWAEIQQSKLEDAQRRLKLIQAERPQLLAKIADRQLASQQLHHDSELYQQLQAAHQSLNNLGYQRSQHQELLQTLQDKQVWQLRYQELQQAQEQFPPYQARLDENSDRREQRQREYQTMQLEIQRLNHQVEHYADHEAQIKTLEASIQSRRRQLDDYLAQKGRYEQQAIQLDILQEQNQEHRQQLQEIKKQYRIHQELAKAFGKNGIQTLMIENILPQLEAETNRILARLTGNQLHIQFVTQKASKATAQRRTPKFIDTLDILIADIQGTRPYETYSGGEAFRINFSIRLALARLLAQRAGTALQLLIIDEGFGTQDAEGCERLVAAINAIAADFACILTVTHIPQFKEAFQQRIEVQKSDQGSKVRILS